MKRPVGCPAGRAATQRTTFATATVTSATPPAVGCSARSPRSRSAWIIGERRCRRAAHEPDLVIVALRGQLRNNAAEAAGLIRQEVEKVVPHGNGLRLPMINTSCRKAFGHEGDFPGYRNVAWDDRERTAAHPVSAVAKLAGGSFGG